jgi:hypothetical protein
MSVDFAHNHENTRRENAIILDGNSMEGFRQVLLVHLCMKAELRRLQDLGP